MQTFYRAERRMREAERANSRSATLCLGGQRGAVVDAGGGSGEKQAARLARIKALHTAVWAFFAGCIVALPLAAWRGAFGWAAILSALVWIECVVLIANGWRCPLTDVAAKYTGDRSPEFDIYLPRWLARHNKTIFGAVFVVNEWIALWLWMRSR